MHGGEDLRMLGQIKVGGGDLVRDLVEGVGVYQNGAQKRLLRNQGKGELSDKFFVHSASL